MDLLFSVITVCYNAQETIEDTILSVIQQTYKRIEYIIIDGNSTDNTLSIINKYKNNIHTIISEKDLGIYDAMNKSFKIANGDFIIFINSGDRFYSNTILQTINDSIDCLDNVYYGNVVFVKNGIKIKVYDSSFDEYKLMFKNICHQSIFYPISLYKSQKYNIKYKLLADWEFNIRIFKIIKFKYLPLKISLYDIDGISSQRKDYAFGKERSKIILKYWGVYYWLCYQYFILIMKIKGLWKRIIKD